MREPMITNPTIALERRLVSLGEQVQRLEADVAKLNRDHYAPVGVGEVAHHLGISRQRVYQLIAKGGTPEPIETEPNRYALGEWVEWYREWKGG